ncbi:MAG: tRNA (guanosine(46)-N7)-methyltransferase TrmB [Planctomycetota bacterium]
MPRSPLRSPSPKLDLSEHLYEFHPPPSGAAPSAAGPSAGMAWGSDTGSESPYRAIPTPVTSESLFQSDHPLEIEIGSGKGLFLTTEAQRNPDHVFLGVEIIHKYAKHSAARLVKAGISNAKMVAGNAEQLLEHHVPAGSLEALHVYFPDPWWKKRHRKRRVVNERSIVSYFKALRPGGRFHFWTDVLDYFEITIEMIAESMPGFGIPIPEEEMVSRHDLDFRTHFERRSRKNQIPVYRVRYEKRAT